MKVSELLVVIKSQATRPDFVCFGVGDPIGDDNKYHIVQDKDRWIVYFVERGEISSLRTFVSEDEACDYLFALIRNDSVVWSGNH